MEGIVGVELKAVCYDSATCGHAKNMCTEVMYERRYEVEYGVCAMGPRSLVRRFDVDEDFTSRWRYWSFKEVVGPKKVLVG